MDAAACRSLDAASCASKACTSCGAHLRPMRSPAAAWCWPSVRTSTVWLPIAHASTRSAPRYSTLRTSAGTPPASSAMSSGRMPTVAAAWHAGVDRAAGDAAGLQGDQVHRRRADEARGKRGGRLRIELARRAVLLDAALAQQHHLVGHAHRLGLIVRDVHHREAQAAAAARAARAASPGAAARRGWTAARPSGRRWPAPPARGRAPRAAAARPTAGSACARAASPGRAAPRSRAAAASRSAAGACRTDRPKVMLSATLRCGNNA